MLPVINPEASFTMAINRKLRLIAGVSALVTAALIVVPHATSHISNAAVINAPVITIKSPFEGILTSKPRQPGELVAPGAGIVTIGATREVKSQIARLEAQRDAMRAQQRAIAAEMTALEALDADLAMRATQIATIAEDVLSIDRARLGQELFGARARAEQHAKHLDSLERLSDVGSVSGMQVRDARTALSVARAEVAALELQAQRIDRELLAITQGTLPAFGSEDGSYSRQRRDEIAIRLADLTTRHDVASAGIESLEREIAALEEEMVRLREFAPRAKNGAVVWTASPSAGSAIPAGDEILQVLDCSRRFVEVAISERAYGAVSVGTTAWVRLRGSENAFLAEVETVRGAGSTPHTGRLAARPLNATDGMLTAVLRLAPPDLSDVETAARFCDVGRLAEVRFERGLIEDLGIQLETMRVEFRALMDRVAARFG